MQVRAALPAYQERWRRQEEEQGDDAAPHAQAELDLESVLWTDPDVLFRQDINTCSLPVPRLLSIGPEVRLGVPGWRQQGEVGLRAEGDATHSWRA